MPAKPSSLPVYMDPIEFSQIMSACQTLAPHICLEWGSGGSTRAILDACPFVERYVSIEHDRAWYEKVRSVVDDKRLELHHVPPEVPMPVRTRFRKRKRFAWEDRAESERSMFDRYIDFPLTLGTMFDFVLVDGRARRFCLTVGWSLLRPGGLIVLHDAQRPSYHDALFALGSVVLLEPWRRGQVALVRKPV